MKLIRPSNEADFIGPSMHVWFGEMCCILYGGDQQPYPIKEVGGGMSVLLSRKPGVIHNSMLPNEVYIAYKQWQKQTAESILVGEQ